VSVPSAPSYVGPTLGLENSTPLALAIQMRLRGKNTKGVQ
jgi:hypothetical protein